MKSSHSKHDFCYAGENGLKKIRAILCEKGFNAFAESVVPDQPVMFA